MINLICCYFCILNDVGIPAEHSRGDEHQYVNLVFKQGLFIIKRSVRKSTCQNSHLKNKESRIMEISVKSKSLKIQKHNRVKRIQDKIITDRSLFPKPLLSSFSSSVLLCDTESNLFTLLSFCSIAALRRLEAVNCIYKLKELTTCQVGVI